MDKLENGTSFSAAQFYCQAGIGLFLLSLILPAAGTGGNLQPGLTLFALGTTFALIFDGSETSILSLVALLMNLSALTSIVAVFNQWQTGKIYYSTVTVGCLTALILALFPYSGFTDLSIGYYLWLLSAVWLVANPYVLIGLLENSTETIQSTDEMVSDKNTKTNNRHVSKLASEF